MKRVLVDSLVASDVPGFACSKSKLVKSGIQHLRPFNIGDDGQLDLSDVYQVPEIEAATKKTRLEAGDILFNNTNSAELVGKAALVPRAMDAGFSNHLTRIRLMPTSSSLLSSHSGFVTYANMAYSQRKRRGGLVRPHTRLRNYGRLRLPCLRFPSSAASSICFPVPRASFACGGRSRRKPPNSSRRCSSRCLVTR